MSDVAFRSHKASDVALEAGPLDKAKQLDVARADEAGLTLTDAGKRAGRWLAENGEAMESSNSYVEENALPLACHRLF